MPVSAYLARTPHCHTRTHARAHTHSESDAQGGRESGRERECVCVQCGREQDTVQHTQNTQTEQACEHTRELLSYACNVACRTVRVIHGMLPFITGFRVSGFGMLPFIPGFRV
jgi:hypothetical protein